MSETPQTYHIFWDGECRFCGRSLSWVMSRDRDKRLKATPYQLADNPPMTDSLSQACSRAVHILHPDGRLERAGQACLTVLSLIGYARLVRPCRKPPIIWFVEMGYWLVARYRNLFSRLLFRSQSPFSHS